MNKANIYFFNEDTDFEPDNKEIYILNILQFIDKEGVDVRNLNFIFSSDEFLLDMNRKYLSHDYYTDIITFYNSENGDLDGDVFISIERAVENAKKFNVGFEEEIKRLMIHGVLHLIGYNDGTAEEKKEMRVKEDYYLSLWID